MTEIQYDQPIQVSAKAYWIIMNKLGGICAGRVEDGKFFIKVWFTEHIPTIKKIIDEN